jgi:hypothetical protein
MKPKNNFQRIWVQRKGYNFISWGIKTSNLTQTQYPHLSFNTSRIKLFHMNTLNQKNRYLKNKIVLIALLSKFFHVRILSIVL